MKYSFIVCAYNAEKYLKECLDSLTNQKSISDYEIILVNDGSKDKTGAIAKKYKKVKIINQENFGLPKARNTGLESAKGEWILYVDADDYVSKNYLEEIEKVIIKNKKINFIKIWERKDCKASKKDEKVQSNKVDDSIVSRAFRKKDFKDYRFPERFKFAIEDWDFYVHNMHKMHLEDITNNKKIFYHYRYNENSLSKTNNIYKSRFDHALSVFEDPKLRKLNLEQNIIGHYWEHLYMIARLWHKDLMPRVKKCRYKTKIRFAIKIQYWIVKLGIFNFLIKKTGNPVNS